MSKKTHVRMFTRQGSSAVYDVESDVAEWLKEDAPSSIHIRGIDTAMAGESGAHARFAVTIWYEENS